MQTTREHAADADAPHIAGVIDGHALHGERRRLVNLGRGHIVNNHIEQRIHIHVAVVGIAAGIPVHRTCIHHVLHGELKLLVGGAKISHKIEAVVVRLLRIGTGAVDLVEHDHDGKAGVDCMAQHEARLGHGTLEGVNEQKRPIGHLEHALDLAAEVGVAGGIDDVDLYALVLNRAVLGENGDSTLALLVVRVEHAVLDLLVSAEGIRGAQQLVHDGGLAVVDVGDDGDIPEIFDAHYYSHCI